MIDLIDESGEDLASCGYEVTKLDRYDVTCCKLFIDTAGKAKKLGFDKGHYFILNAPLISKLPDEHFDFLKNEIKYRLSFLFKENKIKKNDKLLFVGIGNPEIVADSFGSRVASNIEISAFKKNNRRYKICPNTFLNTGINAFEIIKILVEAFDISAVMLFDSLATTNLNRLGCSIQFNDAGLTPGSALNNFGMAINKSSIGVPCISVGVPFMILAGDLSGKFDNEVVLTEKGVKEKVDYLATLIASAINEIVK